MMSRQLAYAALVVRDVEATAEAFERGFGLRRVSLSVGDDGAPAPVFAVGKSALALFPPGHPFVNGRERPGVHHRKANRNDQPCSMWNQFVQCPLGSLLDIGRQERVFAAVSCDTQFRQANNTRPLLTRFVDRIVDVPSITMPIERRLIQDGGGNLDQFHFASPRASRMSFVLIS